MERKPSTTCVRYVCFVAGGSKAASAVFSNSLKTLYLSLAEGAVEPQVPLASLQPSAPRRQLAAEAIAKRQLPAGKAIAPESSNARSQNHQPASLLEVGDLRHCNTYNLHLSSFVMMLLCGVS